MLYILSVQRRQKGLKLSKLNVINFLAWMDGRKLLHESCGKDGMVKWKKNVTNPKFEIRRLILFPEFSKRTV